MLSQDQLFELLKSLNENNVKFVVCGGVACVLQGVERATYDVDISVAMDSKNLQNVIDTAKSFKLVPRIPEPVEKLLDEHAREKWVKEKGAIVYTFVSNDSPLQLDIFLTHHKSFDELLKSSVEYNIDNLKIHVASIDDLLEDKKRIHPIRDKDLTDIKELEQIKRTKNK